MKSVNILMTEGMKAGLDGADCGNSRSARVRTMMAAILAAHRGGNSTAFKVAMEKAQLSDWRIRRMIEEAGLDGWSKGIIWMPQAMHDQIEKLLAGSGLNVSDLVRGAVIGACEFDIEDLANRAALIVWERNSAKAAEDEARAAEEEAAAAAEAELAEAAEAAAEAEAEFEAAVMAEDSDAPVITGGGTGCGKGSELSEVLKRELQAGGEIVVIEVDAADDGRAEDGSDQN